jgi:hypothetical protein
VSVGRKVIDWVSKKQATIETSVFGAKFVAMIHGIEKLLGLCYMLCMMTRPESTLKKKCNSICYHAIQESVVMGESLITHINSEEILSDLMTKVTYGSKCRQLTGNILYDIYNDHPEQ